MTALRSICAKSIRAFETEAGRLTRLLVLLAVV